MNNNPIRILLADDHNVLRQGMAQAIEAQPDMTVIGQADNGLDAINLALKKQPDIILMDINMPQADGVTATQQISAKAPHIGIIILTMYRRDDFVFEAIKAGASGYLLKEVELDELLNAIRTVAKGEAVIDSTIASRVLAELRKPKQKPQTETDKLTERDLEILQLVARGLSNQEIANKLFLAEKTIRNRLSLIFKQLHLENRTQAALYAWREGLVEKEDDDTPKD
ncbi:MAG: DNA-binding response regulator [Bacteroidetes bacterium]|nr:MAG: DNA-binding response regulator [Bacteroidota bacterium]